MSVAAEEQKSCLSCLFYNSDERYCVLWGTYLSSYEACSWYRTEWGEIRWLRSFLERFEKKQKELLWRAVSKL